MISSPMRKARRRRYRLRQSERVLYRALPREAPRPGEPRPGVPRPGEPRPGVPRLEGVPRLGFPRPDVLRPEVLRPEVLRPEVLRPELLRLELPRPPDLCASTSGAHKYHESTTSMAGRMRFIDLLRRYSP